MSNVLAARRATALGVLAVLAASPTLSSQTPGNPGPTGYVLDWESSAEQTVPAAGPPGWGIEYNPTLINNGEPPVRIASKSASEPTRRGQYSARFQLFKTDPPINVGTRAELSSDDIPTDIEPVGAERWYGFSVYLDPITWGTADVSGESVTQWHQSGLTLGGSPPLAIETQNGQWEIEQNWDNTDNNPTPIGAYQTGVWTDWVVHVIWSTGPKGLLEIWKDGVLVQGFGLNGPKMGPNTYTSTVGNYIKIGIYKWCWTPIPNPSTGVPPECPSNPLVTQRIMYYDDLRIFDANGSYGAAAGDPHITTVNGVHYDFQAAGDFVSLRAGHGMEIQTRHTPVATTFTPGPDPYDGLAPQVSVNTAVAARVGTHRVTFQPDSSGIPDPVGLQLRVDGVLTTLSPGGLDLGSGGRVVRSAVGGGIEIDFPNGTLLIVTPGWWNSQRVWYLNLDVYHTPATEGIMGAIAPGSWLPALPNDSSMGPMPATLQQRYTDLYQTFANAWRVAEKTSLFDYGAPIARCDLRNWPQERPPCVVPENPPAKPVARALAQKLCRRLVGENRRADCVFDVRATGARGFANTYLLSQRIQLGTTTTTVTDDRDSTLVGAPVTFTATVARKVSRGRVAPTGTVQFTLDGERAGAPRRLDSISRATFIARNLKTGKHQVSARYIPSRGGGFLASRSRSKPHTVWGASSP